MRLLKQRLRRHNAIEQAHGEPLFTRELPRREQQIVGATKANDARKQPGQAKLSGKVQFSMGRRKIELRRHQAQISIAGERQPHPRSRSVHRGNDGFGNAKVIGKVGVEGLKGPIARFRQGIRRSRIVAALLDMTAQGRGIGAHAKAPPLARHHDRPHGGILHGLVEAIAVFRMHPPRPGVHAFWPGKLQLRHPVQDLVLHDLQLHQFPPPSHHCTRTAPSNTKCARLASRNH